VQAEPLKRGVFVACPAGTVAQRLLARLTEVASAHVPPSAPAEFRKRGTHYAAISGVFVKAGIRIQSHILFAIEVIRRIPTRKFFSLASPSIP
jgi:hypothetical protein